MRCELEIRLAKGVKKEEIDLRYSSKSNMALSVFCNWYGLRVRVIDYDGKERVMDYSTRDLEPYFRPGTVAKTDSTNFQFGAPLQRDIRSMRIRVTHINQGEQPAIISRAWRGYGQPSDFFTAPVQLHVTYNIPHISNPFEMPRRRYCHLNAMLMDISDTHRPTRTGPGNTLENIAYFAKQQRYSRARLEDQASGVREKLAIGHDNRVFGKQFHRLSPSEVDVVAGEIMRYRLLDKMTPLEFENIRQHLTEQFLKGAAPDTIALEQAITYKLADHKGPIIVSIPRKSLPEVVPAVPVVVPKPPELHKQELTLHEEDLAPTLDSENNLFEFANSLLALAAGPSSNIDAPRGEYDLADML